MSILLSGDFHANAQGELNAVSHTTLRKGYGSEKYDRIRYHIILGDGGFMWPGNHRGDLVNYSELACRPFPVLCVIGNHEPMLGMSGLKEADIGIGETVYEINDNPFVAYLKRGKVYAIDGFKFLVLGGALSIDKSSRTPDITWWEKEYWSKQEKRNLFKLLEADSQFDCVLSHTGPQRINLLLFESLMYADKFADEVAFLNEEIDRRIGCREWWCGHWHQNRYYRDPATNRGYQYLYKSTKILDKRDKGITVYNEHGKAERQAGSGL